MNSIHKVIKTIEKHNLIIPHDKILVGLSGGADSVTLLHILYSLSEKYSLTLYAAHINHNMRPTAKRDEDFSRNLCEKLGIEFFVKSADVNAFAKEKSISGEEAGRIIRYDFFDEICKKYKITKIATAHNQNDSAETILMNFIRGSGLKGLIGIPYKRDNIIRPILDLSRDEIENYCKENSLEFMTDETNLTNVYTRNKLRLDVIPYIQNNINSNFTNRIVENSDIIAEENDFIEQYAYNLFTEAIKYENGIYSINSKLLKDCHTAVLRRIMMMYLAKVYNTQKHLERKFIDSSISLMKGQSGKILNLPDNIVLKNDYGILYAVKNIQHTAKNIKIIKTADVLAEKPSKKYIYLKPEFADRIVLRTRKDGDFFYPYGMEGRKKLKNFFSDIKLSRDKRENQPLLVSENDDIIWVVGLRADRRFLADIGENSIRIEVKTND